MLTIATAVADDLADSYASVADATDYHKRRGNTAWLDLGTFEREVALVKATDYLRITYRGAWRNVPADGVPVDVMRACAELAIRSALGDDLLPDQERAVVTETVGPISTTYDRASPTTKRYAIVDRLLSPYLVTSGPMVRLGRA